MINAQYLNISPPEKAIPMSARNVAVYHDGVKLLGRILLPGFDNEEEKAPVVLLLHGFPGHEKFDDLAQALRRCGFVVFRTGFAGCWGSGGNYRFSTLTEDLKANLQYLLDNADELHADTGRIFLIGHSMGGLTVLRALADGLQVKGACLLAPCNLAQRLEEEEEKFDGVFAKALDFIATPNGTIEDLKQDLQGRLEDWRFEQLAARIAIELPLLFVGGSRDGVCPPVTHMNRAVSVLKARGAQVTAVELDSDHSFQDQRPELIETVVSWLIKRDAEMRKMHTMKGFSVY